MAKKSVSFFKSIRFYSSAIATFIFNLGVFGAKFKGAPCPGFNCHGCAWATFACPVGAIANGFSLRHLPAMAIGAVMAIGVVLGRLVCGYACPFGLLQELMYRIPTKKFKIPRWTRYIKYAALLLLVFMLPYILGFETSTENYLYYCTVCPNGALTAMLPNYIGSLTSASTEASVYSPSFMKVFVLIFFLVLMTLVSRGFCRTFCPLGAMYGLLSRFAFWRVSTDRNKCIDCKACHKVCPVDIEPEHEAGGSECISCGACITRCPKSAISRKFGL